MPGLRTSTDPAGLKTPTRRVKWVDASGRVEKFQIERLTMSALMKFIARPETLFSIAAFTFGLGVGLIPVVGDALSGPKVYLEVDSIMTPGQSNVIACFTTKDFPNPGSNSALGNCEAARDQLEARWHNGYRCEVR